jgi:AraC-like DNA-binding protein
MFYYLGLMLAPIFFYHLVYILTNANKPHRLFLLHYAIPPTVFVVFTIWSFCVPFEVRLDLTVSHGVIRSDYKAYSCLFTSPSQAGAIYNIVYILLSLFQALRYNKVIRNYSSNVDKSSLQWVYSFFMLSLILIPLPLASFFISKRELLTSLWTTVPIFLLVVQYAILTYNILTGNYVIIASSQPAPADSDAHHKLTKILFESYIKTEKPYLNPDLKITDLVPFFITNRTDLSNFINKEFGMNFCRYINFLRLQEVESLRQNPEYASYREIDLVYAAGFSSYRRYKNCSNQLGE